MIVPWNASSLFHIGCIASTSILVLRPFWFCSLTRSHRTPDSVEMQSSHSDRHPASLSPCECVMRTLTYGFRRRLVRTFPPWLFCGHCLRQYSPYTMHQQQSQWLLMSLLLLLSLLQFSIFGFIFPKIVVILCALCRVLYCDFGCNCLWSNAPVHCNNTWNATWSVCANDIW